VLLSGGGNDSTRRALAALLQQKGSSSVLDPAAKKAHLEALDESFRIVLKAIEPVIAGTAISVLIHGYDHPFPNGKGGWKLQREWLYDVFKAKGYAVGPGGADMPAASKAMADLIDGLNDKIKELPETFRFVRYVDLRGTIADHHPSAPDGWSDDLHPENKMFEAMAAKIDAMI